MDMQFTVVGLIPVKDRDKCLCAFCGTNKSVKYRLEKKDDPPGADWNCCNRCVLHVASFYRMDLPIYTEGAIPKFPWEEA